jgi:hypothetical protein
MNNRILGIDELADVAIGGSLGLDELMIVNPGPPAAEPDSFDQARNGILPLPQEPDPRRADQFFLGEDGTVYQIQEIEEPGLGQLFLGDDGTLYRFRNSEPDASVRLLELADDDSLSGWHFFLGDDGTLFEVADSSGRANRLRL